MRRIRFRSISEKPRLSSVAITFIVSTLVSLVFIPFSIYQGAEVSRAIIDLRPSSKASKTLRDDPRNVEAYIDQALDIAYGFPTVVLTAISYADLAQGVPWINAVSVPVAVASTLLLAWLSNPKRVNRFLVARVRVRGERYVSGLSASILLLNLVGLIAALWYS